MNGFRDGYSTERDITVIWIGFPIVMPRLHIWRYHMVLHKYATIAVLQLTIKYILGKGIRKLCALVMSSCFILRKKSPKISVPKG